MQFEEYKGKGDLMPVSYRRATEEQAVRQTGRSRRRRNTTCSRATEEQYHNGNEDKHEDVDDSLNRGTDLDDDEPLNGLQSKAKSTANTNDLLQRPR